MDAHNPTRERGIGPSLKRRVGMHLLALRVCISAAAKACRPIARAISALAEIAPNRLSKG